MCFDSPSKPGPKSSELFAGEMGDQLTKFIKTPVLNDVLKESMALGKKDIYQRTKNAMISDTQQAMRGRNPALDFVGARGNSSSLSNADSSLELYGNTIHGARDIAQNFNQGHKMATLSAALGGAGLAAQNFSGISDRQTSINLTKYDQKNKDNIHDMQMVSQGMEILGSEYQDSKSSYNTANDRYEINKSLAEAGGGTYEGKKPGEFTWSTFVKDKANSYF